ncbi:hypothetical protein N431DRAFT_548499 [Stipitochalara longipes BDJ]|nr:hypothetical protein N431DRAFT_548499 [Stipitochalara longipes BDJ]
MSTSEPTHERKQTTFEAAIAVRPLNGSTNIFTANIAWDWCGEYGAWGGYIAALLCQTARTYLTLTRLSSKPAQPDPINSHFQLFYPNTPGPVRLTASLLKPGSRISVVKIELQKTVPPNIPSQGEIIYRTCALGIITMSNISLETGLTLRTEPSVPKEEIPNRETECEQWTLENDPIMEEIYLRAPVNDKLTTWVVKGSQNDGVTDRFGSSVMRTWSCRPGMQEFDILSIVALCDWSQAAPSNFSPKHADLKAGVLYATMSMTTEIKKVPKGAKWLYMRARVNVIKNGRFDMEVHIVDEGGELVAICKHAAVVVEGPLAGRPDEIRKLYKL